ncbi:MAG: AN1-type zinc finger protein [Candidatus Hodarchaeota archaeon]
MSSSVNHVTAIMIVGNTATISALLLLIGAVEISMSPAIAIGATVLLGLLFLGSLLAITLFLSIFQNETPFSIAPKSTTSHLNHEGSSYCAQCGENVFHPYFCVKCSRKFCFEHYNKGDHVCNAI